MVTMRTDNTTAKFRIRMQSLLAQDMYSDRQTLQSSAAVEPPSGVVRESGHRLGAEEFAGQ